MEISMRLDLKQNEIGELEEVLVNFKREWEQEQSDRAREWRSNLFLSFLICVLISIYLPSLWWINVIVIGYFAGSLFMMLRQRVKTNRQILEHQKQLKLVKLLRKFDASPFSKEE